MKIIKTSLFAVAIILLSITEQACKSKKLPVKPTPPVAEVKVVEESKPVAPPAEVKKEEAPAPAPVSKPDYNFSNIQFEFDSAVLKTDSYSTLDHAAAEIKKDAYAKFMINGNSSSEGTEEHNLALSVERANAVKLYLVNAGISADNLTVKGYGTSKPIADNNTEQGKVLNRRVEIKVSQ